MASSSPIIAQLKKQDGVVEDFEFAVVTENDQPLTVGMTTYASREAFQAIAGGIMQEVVTQAYSGTFTPTVAQNAVRSSND
ncbi:MAG: hypothetical protein GYB68_08285 [Chloroflexi bacterium]|nr:hypothetical protein [Chloroflexota bacterium]